MTRPIRPTSNPTPSRPEFIPDGWVFLYDAVQILGNVMHGEDWTEHDSAARNARQIKEEKDRVERFKVVARNRARAPRVHMVGGQGEWPRGVPVSARRVERPKLFDDDESEIAASRRGQEVRSRLRQWLYAHQESAVCLSVDGKNRDIDNSIWASAAADRILQSGWVTINKNSGWVLVQRTYFDLMASLPASMSGEPNDADQGAADEPPAQSEGDEPPAQPDPPRSDQRPKAAKGGRVGNPAYVRGPYYKKLEKCLESQARVLKKDGDNLRDWFSGMTRREFREAVEPALNDADLPTDRTLYDAGKKIVAEIENRHLFD